MKNTPLNLLAFFTLDGIPPFVQPEALTRFNRRFSRIYDGFFWACRSFSIIVFAYVGMSAETGHVLEVSMRSGVNLPYLMNHPIAEKSADYPFCLINLIGKEHHAYFLSSH